MFNYDVNVHCEMFHHYDAVIIDNVICSILVSFLYSLTATFDGYIPWTADVHTYSIDDFQQVRQFPYMYIHVHRNVMYSYTL